MKTIIKVTYFAITMFVSTVQANPVCDVDRGKANSDLKQSLLITYKNSYSTVSMLLKAGMNDYDTICNISNNSINNGILRNLKSTYYPSFSTILMLYKANKKSYDELNN